MNDITIRPIQRADKDWIGEVLQKWWGSTVIVSGGKIRDAATLSGFIAMKESKQIGLVTYVIEKNECEIISLNSLLEKYGVGSQLVEKVIDVAKVQHCKRVWLIETNDNIKALDF